MNPFPNLVVVEFPFTLGITTGGSAARTGEPEQTTSIRRRETHMRICFYRSVDDIKRK